MCRVEQQGDLASNVNASTHGVGGGEASENAGHDADLSPLSLLSSVGGSVVI